ncbi:MAG: diversity-generating retroelement protein Avd [Planctomycetes bacterium]|nr:diversity-generating retroelement protein Avd [Planctomycetota bacterium]
MRDSSVTGVCPGRRLSSCRGVAVALSGGDASREISGGLPCWQAGCMARAVKQPVVLMKWYRVVSWMLDRVDHFPKNQRFVFGQRLAERSIHVLELLVEAAWSQDKTAILAQANREMEVLRWLVRLAHDRKILTAKQYEAAAEGIYECGRMVGGWQKDSQRRAASSPPPRSPPKRDPEKP